MQSTMPIKEVQKLLLFFRVFLEDIENIRKILPIGTSLVSKVETSRSLINIEDILLNSDSVLIDRGDFQRNFDTFSTNSS